MRNVIVLLIVVGLIFKGVFWWRAFQPQSPQLSGIGNVGDVTFGGSLVAMSAALLLLIIRRRTAVFELQLSRSFWVISTSLL